MHNAKSSFNIYLAQVVEAIRSDLDNPVGTLPTLDTDVDSEDIVFPASVRIDWLETDIPDDRVDEGLVSLSVWTDHTLSEEVNNFICDDILKSINLVQTTQGRRGLIDILDYRANPDTPVKIGRLQVEQETGWRDLRESPSGFFHRQIRLKITDLGR